MWKCGAELRSRNWVGRRSYNITNPSFKTEGTASFKSYSCLGLGWQASLARRDSRRRRHRSNHGFFFTTTYVQTEVCGNSELVWLTDTSGYPTDYHRMEYKFWINLQEFVFCDNLKTSRKVASVQFRHKKVVRFNTTSRVPLIIRLVPRQLNMTQAWHLQIRVFIVQTQRPHTHMVTSATGPRVVTHRAVNKAFWMSWMNSAFSSSRFVALCLNKASLSKSDSPSTLFTPEPFNKVHLNSLPFVHAVFVSPLRP